MPGSSPSVVITGAGVVCALGSGLDRAVSAMQGGNSGIAPHKVSGPSGVLFEGLFGGVERQTGETGADLVNDRAVTFSEIAAREALSQAGFESDGALSPGRIYNPWQIMTVLGSSKGRIGNLLHENIMQEKISDGAVSVGGAGRDRGVTLNIAAFPGDTLGREIARRFGFAGAVLNCPAACATGIASIIRGAEALRLGEADLVVAGSAESSGQALLLSAFKNMGALAPTKMKPFDAERCGFNPGEGGAVFILEREADARRRGAVLLARVCGWDYRSDAAHITAADPSGATLAWSVQKTLQRAGWTPSDVDYINAHGTATALNDAVEARAITTVFGETTPPVSSIKPYIGHLLGASSAVELALVLESTRRGFLPPTLGLSSPDLLISLQSIPVNGTYGCFRRILKLSLGFGGHIGVVGLEIL